ncbi:MAG: DNA-directed RNA polymerase subunit RpoH/Rpb5 C-terminal domain-containing protein [Candidatus Micrarchaeota archaeon]
MDSLASHFLVPKAVKLSEDEVSELLSKLKCTVDKLPKVKSDDASVKGLQVVEGDVVKYVRKSPIISGDSFYYRIVISE